MPAAGFTDAGTRRVKVTVWSSPTRVVMFRSVKVRRYTVQVPEAALGIRRASSSRGVRSDQL